MPTMSMVSERELLDLSRVALQLEKLTASADSTPSPVRYLQILRRLSELHCRWQKHIKTSPVVQAWSEPSINVERKLRAISTSSWPRSTEAGLVSIRVAVPGILHLLYQEIARERAAISAVNQRQKVPAFRTPMLVPTAARMKLKQISA